MIISNNRIIKVTALLLSLTISFYSFSQTMQYEDLLQYRSGFAKDVTGGAGGTVITITELGDAGFIQLKNAVMDKDNKKWIRFSPGLNGEILIDQWFTIGSNTTIDGRGANITFTGKGKTDELYVWNDTNVIVHNIRFFEIGREYDEGTAFGISQGADMIWLDHCTFEHNSDESVTIGNEHNGHTGFKSRLTVSYCRWENTLRALLLGHTKDEGANYYTTIHHCSFVSSLNGSGVDGAMYRIPKSRHGKVHMYNCYVSGYHWRATTIQDDGEALLEYNIYDAKEGAAMFCAPDSYDPEPGWICDNGNFLIGGTNKIGDGFICDSVFKATAYYNYELDSTMEIIRSLALSSSGRSDKPVWLTESSPKPYRISIDKVGVGSVKTTPSRSTYYNNEIVSLLAETDLGYKFLRWGGDISGSDNPIQIVMDTNKAVIVDFVEVPIYTLTTTSLGKGHVSSKANGEYNEGAIVKINAFPDWPETFISWKGDIVSTKNPLEISIDSNINIIAEFTGSTGINDYERGKTNALRCYPNPFSGESNIEFEIVKPANVKLSIINTDGKIIAVLIDSKLSSGVHKIRWNTADIFNNISINGIYIVKLAIENEKTVFSKIVLVSQL